MQQLLTKRKARWIEQRKPAVVRGKPLNVPYIVEARYYQKLDKLIERMTANVERRLRALFGTPHAEKYFTAQDDTIASQARILTNQLSLQFNGIFADHAPDLASQFADGADKASSASVHASLKELSGGLSLPVSAINGQMTEILKATVAENVSLIKSISAQYLQGVEGAVMRSITTGNGLQDLLPFLEKHKEITKRRAHMIAMDQTRKATNNLDAGRMKKIGIKKYEWLHSGGSNHPRPLHVSYNGRIFSYDDPPIIDEHTGQRGIPGQAINCRCRQVPVLDFGD